MSPSIVILNDTACIDGGAAAVAVAGAAGLAEAGFQVTFIAAIGPIAPELRRSDIRVVLTQSHRTNSGAPARLRWRSVWNASAANATARVLRETSSLDCVVHAHNWHSALSASAVTTALNRGFKVVCTLNDYCIACPTVGFFDVRSRSVCSLRPLSLKCLLRACTKRRLGKGLAILRQVMQVQAGVPRKINHFITVSSLSESVLRPYLPEGASVYRVSNPIDAPRIRPVAVAHNETYSMVARLDIVKGSLLFAEAAKRGGFKALFIGDGLSRDEIFRANPAVKITGWLRAGEVWTQLRRSRCLVFPSLWYEAQPLAVLQASAVGVPSIVSDACAAREMVEDGVTGLIFRSGDVESLLAAMQRLKDDQLVATLGLNAYNRFWADPPTRQRHAQALASVYERVLAS